MLKIWDFVKGSKTASVLSFASIIIIADSTPRNITSKKAAIPVYVGGVVLPGVLSYFLGISLPGWIWIPFILLFILAPIALSIFGIRPQMKYVRIAAFFEVIFLGVLSAIIIIEAKDNTLAVFNPFTKSQIFNKVGGPLSGLGLGMIFGLTSFIGYGGSAPLGEEAVNSRAITKSLVFGLVIAK